MAIRQIRTIGDEILTKECKPVKEMNERTLELIEDMFETMYENNALPHRRWVSASASWLSMWRTETSMC